MDRGPWGHPSGATFGATSALLACTHAHVSEHLRSPPATNYADDPAGSSISQDSDIQIQVFILPRSLEKC